MSGFYVMIVIVLDSIFYNVVFELMLWLKRERIIIGLNVVLKLV